VPNLQHARFEPPAHEEINDLDVRFATAAQARPLFGAEENKEVTIADLLKGFFVFYARDFDVAKGCVSIKVGGGEYDATTGSYNISKSVWGRANIWRLCVEDPFETHDSHCPHDLGIVIGEQGNETLWVAIRAAATACESQPMEGLTEEEGWAWLFENDKNVKQSMFGRMVKEKKKKKGGWAKGKESQQSPAPKKQQQSPAPRQAPQPSPPNRAEIHAPQQPALQPAPKSRVEKLAQQTAAKSQEQQADELKKKRNTDRQQRRNVANAEKPAAPPTPPANA